MINQGQIFGSYPVFWFGVVEENDDTTSKDGRKLGRLRVRIMGFHSQDKEIDESGQEGIPSDKLFWATPIMPINSSSMNGIGSSPTGTVKGTVVFGVSLDGEAMSDLYVLGTMGGIPEEVPNPAKGFDDPDGNYPKSDHLYEEDTNRLARGENLDRTIVKSKNDIRQQNVRKALKGEFWSEPAPPYNAVYPFNHVRESESGHIFEVDDTAGNERLHQYHNVGSYTEIDKDGVEVQRIQDHHYTLKMADSDTLVIGNNSLGIEKDCNLRVNGNTYVELNGDLFIEVRGNVSLIVDGNVDQYIKGNRNTWIDGNEKIWIEGDKTEFVNGYNNLWNHEDYSIDTWGDFNIQTHGSVNFDTAVDFNVKTTGTVNIETVGEFWNVSNTHIHLFAPLIDFNNILDTRFALPAYVGSSDWDSFFVSQKPEDAYPAWEKGQYSYSTNNVDFGDVLSGNVGSKPQSPSKAQKYGKGYIRKDENGDEWTVIVDIDGNVIREEFWGNKDRNIRMPGVNGPLNPISPLDVVSEDE